MYYAGSSLQQKSQVDNVSQSSKTSFKKFQPRQCKDTSVGRKKLDFVKNIPTDVPVIRSRSKNRNQQGDTSQMSMPNLHIGRNYSTVQLRNFDQEDRVSQKPTNKQVRFTFGKPAEFTAPHTTQVNKDGMRRESEPLLETYIRNISTKNMSSEFKDVETNSEKSSDIQPQIEKIQVKATSTERLVNELQAQIKQCRQIKNLYIQKIQEVKSLQEDLLSYVKMAMDTYNVQTKRLLADFAVRLNKEVRNVQVKFETKMLNKSYNESARRGGQQNLGSHNVQINMKTPPHVPTKLDHSNIMDKLDKIKNKLDQMARAKEQFTEDSTTSGNIEAQQQANVRFKRLSSFTYNTEKPNSNNRTSYEKMT